MDLSFIWWDILCVLTLGILTIYVVPYKLAARAAFYDAVKSSKEVQPVLAQPEVPTAPEVPVAPEAPAVQPPVFVPYTAPAQAEPIPSTYAPEPEAPDAE